MHMSHAHARAQAVTTSALPPCCEALEHSYHTIKEDASIAQVVAAAEARRQQIALNARELATELEGASTPGDTVRPALAAELRAGAETLAAANTACARPRMTTRPQSGKKVSSDVWRPVRAGAPRWRPRPLAWPSAA